jgi:hypothetical protein
LTITTQVSVEFMVEPRVVLGLMVESRVLHAVMHSRPVQFILLPRDINVVQRLI